MFYGDIHHEIKKDKIYLWNKKWSRIKLADLEQEHRKIRNIRLDLGS